MAASSTTFVGASIHNATEANAQLIMPGTLTFGHLVCFGPAPTTAADVFTVLKNGVSQTATCTIPIGGTTFVNSAITLSVAAGDLIDIQVVQGNKAGAVFATLAQ